MNTADDRDERLTEALEEARRLLQTGADASVIAGRHPDLGEELPALIDTLRQLETVASEWRWLSAQTQPWLASASPDGMPAAIGRYRVVARLGEGGMGVVYRAEDPDLQRTVAIKVPRLEGRGDRQQVVERFLREARAAARVRHPHICPIHDVGVDADRPYLVLAFIEGPTLAARLERGRLEDREAVALARQVAEALTALHAAGVVHRDLKPGNVLLDAQGRAFVSDFGLAIPHDAERLTQEGAVIGTPAYMSPEQASGETDQVGPQSDVYSLGVMLYQMLSGKLPFAGPPLAVLAQLAKAREGAPPRPSAHRPGLPPDLEAIVLRAMAGRSEERYPDAAALAADLARWERGEPLPAPPPPAPASRPVKVQVELPGGEPVTVSVDAPAGAKQVQVRVQERPAGKKRRRAVAVLVTITLGLLLAIFGPRWAMDPDDDVVRDLPKVSLRFEKKVGKKEDSPLRLLADARLGAASLSLRLAGAEPMRVMGGNKRSLRKRPYRADVAFDVENAAAQSKRRLPFVVGVLADLSAQSKHPRTPLAKRRILFRNVDRDNFADFLRGLAPRVAFRTSAGGGHAATDVELTFEKWGDFDPAAMKGRLPKALAGRSEEALRHPDLLRLVATWSGLRHLVFGAETGTSLKVHVLDVRRDELMREGREALSIWLANDLGQPGGQPSSLLVADVSIGADAADMRLLRDLAGVAAAGCVPLVAAADPSLVGLTSFAELRGREDLPVRNPGVGEWPAFRRSGEARFVGLTLPRVLAQPRRFQEGQPWMSAGWLFALRVAESQAQYSWPGRVSELEGADGVAYDFTSPARGGDKKDEQVTCLEVPLTPVQDLQLSQAGFLPARYQPENKKVSFLEARSCYEPKTDTGEDRLSVMLCVTTFARTLSVLGSQSLAGFREAPEVEQFLNRWLAGFVLAEGKDVTLEQRSRRPLAEGRVKLRPVKGKAWSYELECELRPAFQMNPVPKAPVRLLAPVYTRDDLQRLSRGRR